MKKSNPNNIKSFRVMMMVDDRRRYREINQKVKKNSERGEFRKDRGVTNSSLE